MIKEVIPVTHQHGVIAVDCSLYQYVVLHACITCGTAVGYR